MKRPPLPSRDGAAERSAAGIETYSVRISVAAVVSLATRAADELGEFLHVVVLWFLLNSAFTPVSVVVSAVPIPLARQSLYALVLSAIGVGVFRYYDPSWDLIRGFVVGVATAASFTSLYVLSGLGPVVAAGGSWRAFGGVVALWIVSLGVGVALAHPRTWRALRGYAAVE